MHTTLLIGHGKMGGALLSRWRQSLGGDFAVIDPQDHAPGIHPDLASLPETVHPDVIVFAVKPQELASILPAYKARFGSSPLYLSIAAGKSLAFFAQNLGNTAQIVRAMPNTPALVGKGITVLCASDTVSAANRDKAESLMREAGAVQWLDNESHMDAVTALSGSGPAYTFLFLDGLTKAGVSAGLSPEMSRALALQTVAGSCALAEHSADSFAQLRRNVTSPGGTTEAALAVLMKDDRLEALVDEAVQAAAKRSRELA